MARVVSKTAPQAMYESASGNADRLKRMAKVAERFAGWRPALDVLVEVKSVRTIFPWVDSVTRVGGWPIERFGLLHGPSNEGKTEFLMGLGLSFLRAGHFFAHVDAEYTTPARWLRTLMGAYAEHPGFRALRPRTYEETVDSVRAFCEAIGEAKAKGELEPDTTGLVGLDSIRKLVPKKLLEKLMKEGAEGGGEEDRRPSRFRKKPGGVDGMGGRAAQVKAALNAAWVDELVPMLAQTGTAMVVIARETEDPDAGIFDAGYKVGGGKALFFDSSLVVRTQRASFVREGEGRDAILYGERRSVEIHKTKVGGKDERLPEAWYHTSNGNLDGVPEGFDVGRDLLELGLELDVVRQAGSSFSWGKVKLGQGKHAAVRRLHRDPEAMQGIEREVREVVDARDKAASK